MYLGRTHARVQDYTQYLQQPGLLCLLWSRMIVQDGRAFYS